MTGADSQKCKWIDNICNKYAVDFVSIQEHFKTVKSTHQWFQSQFEDWHSYTIPAYRLAGIDSGRGRGGLLQLSRKQLQVSKQKVICCSPRIQAQRITLSSFKILWLNTYMPCDVQSQNQDNQELIETLSEVESTINKHSDCEILWSGDMYLSLC